jgi:phosphoribosylformimino-5-aminoimidazole carboxamide ribotide isomerase
MEIVLALDLLGGVVVHGRRGERESYRPLDFGPVGTSDPLTLIERLKPRSCYIADLDRLMGRGDQTELIGACAARVDRCYVDRGIQSPEDFLGTGNVENVVGTETAGSDLARYDGGYLSVDIKGGRVIPSDDDPVAFCARAREWRFNGAIVLNITSVGTEGGLPIPMLAGIRGAYPGRLLYGGGIGGERDLKNLDDLGYDGAIVATAVHRGTIPALSIEVGWWC